MAARGERTINAAGREVRVLFTNRALLSAEKQIGKGILAVLDGFVSGVSGYTELVALLRAGMEAARQDARDAGKPVSNNDAIDVLDEVGFAGAAGPVMEAVSAVIGYNPDGEQPEDDDPNF